MSWLFCNGGAFTNAGTYEPEVNIRKDSADEVGTFRRDPKKSTNGHSRRVEIPRSSIKIRTTEQRHDTKSYFT